jgi:hypothetical protein
VATASKLTGGDGVGVLGRNTGDGGDTVGVKGEGGFTGVRGDTPNTGVRGKGSIGVRGESPNGYGGHSQGVKAQLKLLPNATSGRSTTGAHQQGELFMSSTGISTAELFICTRSGYPGTWRKFTTAPA